MRQRRARLRRRAGAARSGSAAAPAGRPCSLCASSCSAGRRGAACRRAASALQLRIPAAFGRSSTSSPSSTSGLSSRPSITPPAAPPRRPRRARRRTRGTTRAARPARGRTGSSPGRRSSAALDGEVEREVRALLRAHRRLVEPQLDLEAVRARDEPVARRQELAPGAAPSTRSVATSGPASSTMMETRPRVLRARRVEPGDVAVTGEAVAAASCRPLARSRSERTAPVAGSSSTARRSLSSRRPRRPRPRAGGERRAGRRPAGARARRPERPPPTPRANRRAGAGSAAAGRARRRRVRPRPPAGAGAAAARARSAAGRRCPRRRSGRPPLRRAEGLGEQGAREPVRLDREGALVVPLRDDVGPVGLGDAGRGAPRVLVPQEQLAPALVGALAREARRAVQGRERLGLHQPPGRRARGRLLGGARQRPVLPVRRHVAAPLGQLPAVAPLELAEHVLRRADREPRRVVGLVPALHPVAQVRVDRAVVAAHGVAHLHELVRVAALGQLARVVEHAARRDVRVAAEVAAVEPGVAAARDPHEQALASRRARPTRRDGRRAPTASSRCGRRRRASGSACSSGRSRSSARRPGPGPSPTARRGRGCRCASRPG